MNSSGPSLTGETVTISYLTETHAGYGRFALTNPGDQPITASVDAAWLELASGHLDLTGVSVFDTERNQPSDPQALHVGPRETFRFMLGFPWVPYEPSFGESPAVGLRLSAGGAVLEARSPLNFVRRIPLRRQ